MRQERGRWRGGGGWRWCRRSWKTGDSEAGNHDITTGFLAIRSGKFRGKWDSYLLTSSLLGAPTLTFRQRERTASMILELELQQSTRRHAALYFSIVRRKECCASLERRSTSFKTRTGRGGGGRGGMGRRREGISGCVAVDGEGAGVGTVVQCRGRNIGKKAKNKNKIWNNDVINI